MRTENFPIEGEVLNTFIEKNRRFWQDGTQEEQKPQDFRESCGDKNSSWIYVNLSMVRMQVSWVLPKLLYARGMSEKTGFPVMVFTWKKNPELSAFIRSFGFEHISIDELNLHSPMAGLKAAAKTAGVFLSTPDGESLQELRFSDIHVGESLYEDILRTSSLSTIRSARLPLIMKKIFHLSWSFYALENMIRNRKICFGLMDDSAYHEGIFA